MARSAARRRVAAGTRFRWRLSEAATVAVAIQRTVKGVRARGGRCVALAKGRKGRSCSRTVAVTTLRARSAAGAGGIAFTGRVGRRALAAGRYRAVVTATDAAGNRSGAKTLRFRIVR